MTLEHCLLAAEILAALVALMSTVRWPPSRPPPAAPLPRISWTGRRWMMTPWTSVNRSQAWAPSSLCPAFTNPAPASAPLPRALSAVAPAGAPAGEGCTLPPAPPHPTWHPPLPARAAPAGPRPRIRERGPVSPLRRRQAAPPPRSGNPGVLSSRTRHQARPSFGRWRRARSAMAPGKWRSKPSPQTTQTRRRGCPPTRTRSRSGRGRRTPRVRIFLRRRSSPPPASPTRPRRRRPRRRRFRRSSPRAPTPHPVMNSRASSRRSGLVTRCPILVTRHTRRRQWVRWGEGWRRRAPACPPLPPPRRPRPRRSPVGP
eukprot:Hpha_TRINITY_DN12134_c0_g1::TRINITY_DN12134_c0_g1_i1::g.81714::m.81714